MDTRQVNCPVFALILVTGMHNACSVFAVNENAAVRKNWNRLGMAIPAAAVGMK
jgi:hypothetical protein